MTGRRKNKSGFTLIEMMIFILIFSITSITFYRGLSSGTKAMSNVKQRLDALALANEKMEIIHNLDYDKIGTVNGIPQGELLDEESVMQDNRNYLVKTSIRYVDDPFDGTLSTGDAKPNDYKQIKVQVYWNGNDPSSSVSLTGTISPPGVESLYTGGILLVRVVNELGQGIENAEVRVTNNNLSPIVNESIATDRDGNAAFIGAKGDPAENYHISVTKTNYFPVETYAPYPTSSVYPMFKNAIVKEGELNSISLTINLVSSVKISTKDPLGVVIPNIDFGLNGGLLIAHTTDGTPVYSYDDQSLNTDSQGESNFSQMSNGFYTFTFKPTTNNANYELLGLSQASTKNNEFILPAGSTLEETAILADKNVDSLLVNVQESDLSPIEVASVELKNADDTYHVTITTNKFGQAYFPDASAPLVGGNYQFKVTSGGHQDSDWINVNINKLTKQTVTLTATP